MSNKLKTFSLYLLGGLVVIGVVALAGSLTPGGNTSTPTMYTLSDIYNKLTVPAYTSSPTHSVSTTSSPLASMRTLTEIWNAIVIKTGDVAVVTTSTSTNKLLLTVPAGTYLGSATVSTTSTAFTSANIKSGVDLFGIIGELSSGPALNCSVPAGSSLAWSASQGSLNWTNAGIACAALGSCWRLPTIDELVAGLTAQFVDVPSTEGGFAEGSYYWSSTEFGESYAWYAIYYYGDVLSLSNSKNFEFSVRCVR